MATRKIDRSKAPPAPTAHYILGLKERYDSESKHVKARWEDIRQVRDGSYIPDIPKEFAGKPTRCIRTKRIGDTLTRVISTVSRNFPTVAVPPPSPTEAQQKLSTKKEEFFNAGLQEMDGANEPERAFQAGMDYSCTYGMAWWKLVYTPDSWFDMPTAKSVYKRKETDLSEDEWTTLEGKRDDYKKGKLPFAWTAPDPMTTWGIFHNRQLVEVIEVTERPVNDLLRRYDVQWVPDGDGGHLEPATLGQPFEEGKAPGYGQTVTFVEHWDETYVTYLADQTIVAQWKHGYKRVPYFPFYGLTQYTAQPGARGESVVEHVVDSEKALDALLSMKRQWAEMAAYSMGVTEAEDAMKAGPWLDVEGEGERQTSTITFEPGKFKQLPAGWKFRWLEAPPVGKDLTEMIVYVDGNLQQVVPNVLKGIASGTDQPGYSIYLLTTAARLKYDPITDNAGVALGRMVEFWQWLIEHRVKETVYVLSEITDGDVTTSKWIGIGPEDLNGYYKCTVNLAALLPSNRQMEVQMGLSLFQANAITWKTLLEEYVHKPDPEREMRAKLRERAIYDPASPLYAWAMDEALKEAKLDRVLAEQKREAELALQQELMGMQEMAGQDQMMAQQQAAMQGGISPQVANMPTIPPAQPPMGATVGAGGGTGMGNLPGAGLPSTANAPGAGLPGGEMTGLP